MKTKRIQQFDVAQGTFDHGFGGHTVIFFKDIFFQRTGIDTDTNRNAGISGTVHHGPHFFSTSNIAGINPQSIRTGQGCCNGQPVIKMDIGNQGN